MNEKNKTIILLTTTIVICTLAILMVFNKKGKNLKGEAKMITYTTSYSDLGITSMNEEGLLNFSDASSGKTVILCDKPNCKHNDYNCNGKIDGLGELAVIYNDMLFFTEVEEGNHILYRANPNGGNKKALVNLGRLQDNSSAIIYDNYIIMGYRKQYIYEEYSPVEAGMLDQPIVGLAIINLKNNNVTYLPEKVAYDSNIRKLHIYNNKIYYSYEYLGVKIDFMDFDNLDFDYIYENSYFEIYSYDMKTGVESLLYKEQGKTVEEFSGEYAFISEKLSDSYDSYCIYSYNLLTEEKEKIIDECRYPYCYGDGERIIYHGLAPNGVEVKDKTINHFYYYDMASKESFYIGECNQEEVSAIVAIFEEYIYITYGPEFEEVNTASIHKSDFYKGDFDKKTQLHIY